MPFTPFHFGPGLLGKGLAPRWFSWSSFVAANVVIDFESLYYLSSNKYPVHRQLHTFLGASIAGLATACLLLAARGLLPSLGLWFAKRSPTTRAEATTLGIAVGAMVGALTHPLLDGLMHPDIEPFQPWTSDNPLRDGIGLRALHLGCLLAGLVGLVLVIIWRARDRRSAR